MPLPRKHGSPGLVEGVSLSPARSTSPKLNASTTSTGPKTTTLATASAEALAAQLALVRESGATSPGPAKRHYIETEAHRAAVSYARTRRDEAPPAGPSPQTVLHGVGDLPPLPPSKTPEPSMMAAGLPASSTTGSSAPKLAGSERNVPARVRALQQAIMEQQMLLQQQAGQGEARPPRPPSSSSGTPIPQLREVTPLPSLEVELSEIEKMNLPQAGAAARVARARKDKGEALKRTTQTPGSSRTDSRLDAPPRAPSALDDVEPFVDKVDSAELEGDAKMTATGKPIHVPFTPDLRAKLSPSTSVHTHVTPKPLCIRDYVILAEACQRAGRARMEGHAYYKIGETLAKDKGTLLKSIVYFKKYLNISRRLNDLQGEAKALNCLGIVYYELGGSENMSVSLQYHRQHSEIADAAGIYIANTNMGLAHVKLGDTQAAMECFKTALQYAVRAGDKAAESLALANLGAVGTRQGDFATARVCVERHLELAATLQDTHGSGEAYEQLGELATQRGDFATAYDNFLLALDVAAKNNNQELAKRLRCRVGYAQGMLRVEELMKATSQGMGPAK